jgi:hypothetical protein
MDWINKELDAYNKNDEIAKIAFLKFENNKIVSLKIDFSAPFEKKLDKFEELKAWIPVKVLKEENVYEEMFWTLNTANPFYRELLNAGNSGQTNFKIIKTGQGQDTRYAVVN